MKNPVLELRSASLMLLAACAVADALIFVWYAKRYPVTDNYRA